MLQSIGSMKSAIVALSPKGASMLQLSQHSREADAIFRSVSIQAKKHASLLSELTTPTERRALRSFVQSGTLYAPQGGEILGILGAMKESFETNLAESQKTEASQADAFAQLEAAKSDEIKAGQDQVAAKTQELAAAGEGTTTSKQDLEDTQASLAADTKFLAGLKESCANVDQEYEERTKSRQLEMAAVGKALDFLSSDEAHELFSKTLNLLQGRSEARVEATSRLRVVRTLQP